MSKIIKLPCHEITIYISDGKGDIQSDLKGDPWARCIENESYMAAIDGITSIILAHAIAGVDVESPTYIEGIETAVETILETLLFQ